MLTHQQIEDIFTYHAPDEEKKKKHEMARGAVKNVAHLFNNSLPECREKSLALTHLQSAVMFANAAIAMEKKENAS